MFKLPAAILWDMDGTIIDTEPAWVTAEKNLLQTYDAKFDSRDADDWVGIGLWELAQKIQDRGVPLTEDEIVKQLTEAVNSEIFSGELHWRPGAKQLLADFVALGVPNALVTMATRSQALRIVAELPEGTFETVTAGDDVPRPKPNPDPYLIGAASVQAQPEDCIAIEDSVTGVLSANSAGTFVIAVPNLVNLDTAPAHITINSLADTTARDIVEMFNNQRQ